MLLPYPKSSLNSRNKKCFLKTEKLYRLIFQPLCYIFNIENKALRLTLSKIECFTLIMITLMKNCILFYEQAQFYIAISLNITEKLMIS